MVESMVNHAIELDPELENAQKLNQCLGLRKQVKGLADPAATMAVVPEASVHGSPVKQD